MESQRRRMLELAAAPLLYLIAVAERLRLWRAPPYGDEGAYFALAQRFDVAPEGLTHLWGGLWYEGRHLIALFPLQPFLLHPGARFGFEWLRLEHLLLTSLIPVAAYAVLRLHGMGIVAAALAGLVLAFHPHFVVWNVLVLPDALTALFLLLGLAARASGRTRAGILLLLAAVWIKETGVLVFCAVVGWDLVQGWRRREWSVRPLRTGPVHGLRLAALAVAPIPFLLFVLLGGPVPGGHASTPWRPLVDQLVLTAWVYPALLAGLFLPARRFLPAVGLLYPAAFLAYRLVLGRSVEIWYMTIPATLAVVGAAAALAAWAQRLRGSRRGAPIGAALVLVLVVGAQTFVPLAERNVALTMPASGYRTLDLDETIAYERGRDADIAEALRAIDARADRPWLFVDVYWSVLVHPVSAHARSGGSYAYSYDIGLTRAQEVLDRDVAPLAATVAQRPTLVEKAPAFALNRAVQAVYADCVAMENGRFLLLEGCGERGEALAAAYRDEAGA